MTSVGISQRTAPWTSGAAIGVVALFLAGGVAMGVVETGGAQTCTAPAGAYDALAAARTNLSMAQTDRDRAAMGGSLYAAAKIGATPMSAAAAEAADARFIAAQSAFRRLCRG